MVQAMRAFREVGFDGPMVEDHVPEMAGGPEQWPAKAFARGSMRAVMQAAATDSRQRPLAARGTSARRFRLIGTGAAVGLFRGHPFL